MGILLHICCFTSTHSAPPANGSKMFCFCTSPTKPPPWVRKMGKERQPVLLRRSLVWMNERSGAVCLYLYLAVLLAGRQTTAAAVQPANVIIFSGNHIMWFIGRDDMVGVNYIVLARSAEKEHKCIVNWQLASVFEVGEHPPHNRVRIVCTEPNKSFG